MDVALAVVRPFVAAFGEIAEFCQKRAAVLGGRLRRSIRTLVKGYRIKQPLKERAELGVRRRPIAPRMRLDPLPEMAERFCEAEMLEQFVYFIIHGRQAEFFRQGRTQRRTIPLTERNDIACPAPGRARRRFPNRAPGSGASPGQPHE
jgi:hypothetical protein